MKYLPILLLIIQYPILGQSVYFEENKHISGPANVRTAAEGELKVTLNIFIDVVVRSENEDWVHIGVHCFVNQEEVSALKEMGQGKYRGVLKKNSKLYVYRGNEIGVIKEEVKFESD